MNTKRIMVEKRHLVVPLMLAIAANVLLYAVVVFPLGRQVASAEAEASVQRDQLIRARQEFLSAKATVAGKQQADEALQTFYKEVLPGDSATARKLTFTRLAQIAKQANVQLHHGTNTVARLKDSQLAKLTTSYTLAGDYRNVRKFIYALETAPEFIVLENVGLSAAQGDEPQQQQQRVLSMSLEIATYSGPVMVASNALQRPRPVILGLAAAVVAVLIIWVVWPAASQSPASSNQARVPRTPVTQTATTGREGTPPGQLGVRLGDLKQPPPEPDDAGRNPFRFYVKPPPPPPPPPVYVPPPPPPPVDPNYKPPPPAPPPIPLKFIGTLEQGKTKVAIFSDGRGLPQYAAEGATVLGQYRLVRIGVESVVMEYLDGRSRQTIPMRGGQN